MRTAIVTILTAIISISSIPALAQNCDQWAEAVQSHWYGVWHDDNYDCRLLCDVPDECVDFEGNPVPLTDHPSNIARILENADYQQCANGAESYADNRAASKWETCNSHDHGQSATCCSANPWFGSYHCQ